MNELLDTSASVRVALEQHDAPELEPPIPEQESRAAEILILAAILIGVVIVLVGLSRLDDGGDAVAAPPSSVPQAQEPTSASQQGNELQADQTQTTPATQDPPLASYSLVDIETPNGFTDLVDIAATEFPKRLLGLTDKGALFSSRDGTEWQPMESNLPEGIPIAVSSEDNFLLLAVDQSPGERLSVGAYPAYAISFWFSGDGREWNQIGTQLDDDPMLATGQGLIESVDFNSERALITTIGQRATTSLLGELLKTEWVPSGVSAFDICGVSQNDAAMTDFVTCEGESKFTVPTDAIEKHLGNAADAVSSNVGLERVRTRPRTDWFLPR